MMPASVTPKIEPDSVSAAEAAHVQCLLPLEVPVSMTHWQACAGCTTLAWALTPVLSAAAASLD